MKLNKKITNSRSSLLLLFISFIIINRDNTSFLFNKLFVVIRRLCFLSNNKIKFISDLKQQ